MEALAHATVGDEVQTWSALDRAEAAAERIATPDQPPWPWVFPFDARKIASHRLACAVRLHRPDVVYAAVEDLSRLSQATTVHRLEFTESSAESHMAASTLMITMISELFAV